MILNIKKGSIPSIISLPTSKSYANRALILGAQKINQTSFYNLPKASDVTNLISALKEVGLDIIENDKKLTFLNSFPSCEASQHLRIIHVGEGGTTARFLACMLTKGKNPYVLKLGHRLKERPWSEFIDFVNSHGGKSKLEDDELFIQGPLVLNDDIKMDCSRTTQFATGFDLTYGDTVKIIPINLETSQSYWEMTLDLRRNLHNKSVYTTPIDWSSASYPLAFAALNQKTFFPDLRPDKLQADSKFYNLLESLGQLEQTDLGVTITPKSVSKNIQIDVSDCLDLVPTLIYFLSYTEGTHELTGVENLVHKESDRLAESLRILKAFGVEHSSSLSVLKIVGSQERWNQSVTLQLPDDHRMVMSASLFMRHNLGGRVSPQEAVNKSFPDFFNLFD